MQIFENNNLNFILFEIIIFFILIINYKRITKKFNLYDYPTNARKIHKEPVSVIGGFLIFLIVLFNFFAFRDNLLLNNFQSISSIVVLSLFFLVGLIDDKNKFKLNNKIFFIIFFIFFLISINQELIIKKVFFEFFNKEVYLFDFSILFTCLCVFLLFNAINLMDGANGILLSFFSFFYIIFFNQLDKLFFLFNFFLIIILLIYNLKGKFFCGNNGANLISIFISIVIIINYNNKIPIYNNIMLSAELIFLIFILPGIDMLRIFSERIYKNESPLKADNSHFHHLLMSLVNKDLVFLPYTIMAIIPFILAMMNFDKMLIIILFIILYILIIYKLKKKSKF